DVARLVGREQLGLGLINLAVANGLAVDEERDHSALCRATACVIELDANLVTACRKPVSALHVVLLDPEEVVAVLELPVLRVEAPSAGYSADCYDHSFDLVFRDDEIGGDGVRLVVQVEDRAFGEPAHAAEKELAVALYELRSAGDVRVGPLDHSVV